MNLRLSEKSWSIRTILIWSMLYKLVRFWWKDLKCFLTHHHVKWQVALFTFKRVSYQMNIKRKRLKNDIKTPKECLPFKKDNQNLPKLKCSLHGKKMWIVWFKVSSSRCRKIFKASKNQNQNYFRKSSTDERIWK